MVRDAENSYRSLDVLEDASMMQIHGHSITYRTAVDAQQGRKVFTLQTIDPKIEHPVDYGHVAKRLRILQYKTESICHLFVLSSKKFLFPKALGNEMHN